MSCLTFPCARTKMKKVRYRFVHILPTSGKKLEIAVRVAYFLGGQDIICQEGKELVAIE